MHNLFSLGDFASAGWSSFSAATDINDLGQIVGTGILNGSGRAFLLSPVTAPVPEPETYAMMLCGLGLVGTIARRRQKEKAKSAHS